MSDLAATLQYNTSWAAAKIRVILINMSKVESIEKQIADLPEEDLARLRKWFAEFDAALWDRQIERDSPAGKLDALIDEAIEEDAAGKTRTL